MPMTDTTPREPTQVNALGLVGTAVVSASTGDQVGTAVADIISWYLTVSCNCTPPPVVLGAIHTLSVAAIVLGACLLHVKIFKQNN